MVAQSSMLSAEIIPDTQAPRRSEHTRTTKNIPATQNPPVPHSFTFYLGDAGRRKRGRLLVLIGINQFSPPGYLSIHKDKHLYISVGHPDDTWIYPYPIPRRETRGWRNRNF